MHERRRPSAPIETPAKCRKAAEMRPSACCYSGSASAFRFAIALLMAVSACTRSSEPPRNLVLISLDTLAPRRMSVYGAERHTTPTIDRLALDSVVFTDAISTASWTLPAHASMLSGLYPTSLSRDPNDTRLYNLAPLVSELFRQNGYKTAAVTENGFVSAKLGANAGFDYYRETLKGNVAHEALLWLESKPQDPFFFFVHTYTAHIPYHDRRYVEDLPGGRIQHLYTDQAPPLQHWAVCCSGMQLSEVELEYLLALYDGGVSAADEIVARILTRLDELDLLDITAITITSDHGEEFFEHTQRGAYHGHTLYKDLLSVPLIWHEPGSTIRPGRVREPVSIVDIVPTIISRFGLDDEETRDGVDLSELLEAGRWSRSHPLFAEGTRHGPQRYSVQTAAGKLIYTPEPEVQSEEGLKWPIPVRAPIELYLPSDPGEERNVAGDPSKADLAETMFRTLAKHIEGAVGAGEETPEPVADDALNERLRELGYVE